MASLTDTVPTIRSKFKTRLRELLYLDLALVGTVVPIWLFSRYLMAEPFSLNQFFADAFANSVATLFTVDVIIASVAFWFLAAQEMTRLGTGKGKLPIFMLMNICLGLCSGLPAFMWWRERQLHKINQ